MGSWATVGMFFLIMLSALLLVYERIKFIHLFEHLHMHKHMNFTTFQIIQQLFSPPHLTDIQLLNLFTSLYM